MGECDVMMNWLFFLVWFIIRCRSVSCFRGERGVLGLLRR